MGKLISIIIAVSFLCSCGDDSETNDNNLDGDPKLGFTFTENCDLPVCREGFQPYPSCDLPDEDVFANALQSVACETEEDCKDDETCLRARSTYFCAQKSLGTWTGAYKWYNNCSWKLVEEKHTECPIVGGWIEDDKLVSFEQCSEADSGKICQQGKCSPTINLTKLSVLQTIRCTEDGPVYILFKNNQDWPTSFKLAEYNGSLTELHSLSPYEEYGHNYYGSLAAQLFCDPNGELLWMFSNSVKKLNNDKSLSEILHTDAIANQLKAAKGESYYFIALMNLAFNSTHPYRIELSAATNYRETIAINYDTDTKKLEYRSFPANSYYFSMIALGNGKWLKTDSTKCSLIEGQNEEKELFNLSGMESITGFDGPNGIITKTLTRLFFREIKEGAKSKAIDIGLPFPATYAHYAPVIRFADFKHSGGKNPAYVILQYRTLNSNNQVNPPMPMD